MFEHQPIFLYSNFMNKVDILKLEKITVQNFFTIFAQFCAKSVQNEGCVLRKYTFKTLDI